MKTDYKLGIVLVLIGALVVVSCTKEQLFDLFGDKTDKVTQTTSSNADPSKELEPIEPAPVTKYCKYNVTQSTVPGLSTGDIACMPCVDPCAERVQNQPVFNSQGVHIGDFSGKIANTDKSCKKCPTDGFII
ncbi:MAG: hypothetical protein KDC44_19995 [Phaeodactylibacter sp.]|nr:hypothetical protein [Phaeodactylibacter sp.]